MRRLLLTTAFVCAGAAPASAAVRLTETPPEITSQATATFRFASDSAFPPSGYDCSIDGADHACSSPQVYSGLGTGRHTFSVRASGILDSEPASYSWDVDRRSPDTELFSGPRALTRDHFGDFHMESDEGDGAQLECRLDGSSWLPCPLRLHVPDIADGPHTFQGRSRDQAGNIDASPAARSWVVDDAAPVVRVQVVAAAHRGAARSDEPVARLVNPSGGHSLILRPGGMLVRGQVADASRVSRIEVALRRTGAACRFFDGRRSVRLRACNSPRWLVVRRTGDQWSYRLPRGAHVLRGSYRLLVRARDAAGNASTAFTLRPIASAPATLRVLTFNATGGPVPGPAFRVEPLASLLAGQEADVIALQEVCSWAVEALVVRLSAAGYRYYAHLPAISGIGDPRQEAPGSCDFGNAVVSRLPLTRPSARSGSWLVTPPACKYLATQPVFAECRLATSVDVVPPGSDRPVRLSAVQIGPDRDPLQTRETAGLVRMAVAGPDRAIVFGDFNQTPDDPRLDPLRDGGYRLAGGGATYPYTSTDTPFLQIDGIWFRGGSRYRTRVLDPEVCDQTGGCVAISDHRALFSTLTFP